MRNDKHLKKPSLLFVLAALTSSIPLLASMGDYKKDISIISQQIIDTAEDIKQETDKSVLNSEEIEFLLDDMKEMLRDYESLLAFAESPYPGEILLGKTPHVNDAWTEAECTSRYDGLIKELRIRRTGSSARYLRINDIELTYMTPKGPEKQTLNQNANERLYLGDVFKLALPKPMKITKVRISVQHESNGLIISGVPYNFEPPRPRIDRSKRPAQLLLGTTPPGDDTWLETVCDGTARPVREIQLKRIDRKAVYLRINDIEITYQTPSGPQKKVFNKDGNVRLYFEGTYSLILPQPMRVTHIRIRIEHESEGLQVYGIY